jgi:hypothetical protein
LPFLGGVALYRVPIFGEFGGMPYLMMLVIFSLVALLVTCALIA